MSKKYSPNNLLKRERERHNWTHTDVANKIGLSDPHSVGRWERGEVFPGPRYRRELSRVFGKSMAELGLVKPQQSGNDDEDNRTRIFISYSYTDKKYLEELLSHLRYYQRIGNIDFWDDTKIAPGLPWYSEIERAIKEVKIFILLVSPDYLASNFVMSREVPAILNVAKQSGATIWSIIVRPVKFEDLSLAEYQPLNSPSMPLSMMTVFARDKQWAYVSQLIKDKFSAETSTSRASSDANLSSKKVLEPEKIRIALYTYHSHSDRVNAIRWSPDGHYIASASDDHTTQLWDALTGSHVLTLSGHSHFVLALSWSPTSLYIVSGGMDKTVRVWDIANAQELYTSTYQKPIAALAWSPSGQYVAVATASVWPYKSDSDSINLMDAFSGQIITTHRTPSRASAALAWSPDGKYVVAAGTEGKIEVMRVNQDGFVLAHTLISDADEVSALDWSPDGRFIASGGDDSRVQIWGAVTANLVNTYHGYTGPIRVLAWSPDGRYIAFSGEDRAVQVWSVATSRLIQTYYGHTDAVLALAWSPDGQRLASAGHDKTVQVWRMDVPATLDNAEYWLQEGNIYLEGQRYEDALSAYERALKLDPNFALAYANKGRTLFGLARYEEALNSINQAIRRDPRDISFYNNKKEFLLQLQRYEEALATLQEALQLAQKQGNLLVEQNELYQLGQVNMVMGRLQEAKDNFEASMSISHKMRDTLNERRALLSLGALARQQGSLGEAEQYLKRVLNISGPLSDSQGILDALTALGQIARDQKRLEQSEQYYKQAVYIADQLEDRDRQEELLLGLGELAVETQRFVEAEDYFRQAFVIAEQSEDLEKQHNILLALGNLAISFHEWEKAERYLQQALDISRKLGDPQKEQSAPSALSRLAQVYNVDDK
jgi:WD40 repeat protein/Tfp pilus assembly protein PilF/transcriptional regulator with XRE-family HTH domain